MLDLDLNALDNYYESVKAKIDHYKAKYVTGKIIPYLRISTKNNVKQSLTSQRHLMSAVTDGVTCIEDQATGTNTDRDGFKMLKMIVSEGDLILTHSMDRISRDDLDLFTFLDHLRNKKACIYFIQEGLFFYYDVEQNNLVGEDKSNNLYLYIKAHMNKVATDDARAKRRQGIARAKLAGNKFNYILDANGKKLLKSEISFKQKDKEYMLRRIQEGAKCSDLFKDRNLPRNVSFQTYWGWYKKLKDSLTEKT
jgi:DNA invertase Pin-like site-specific DNA recombinase